MKIMFHYNWKVREDWFQLLAQLPPEELTRERVGGLGTFVRTLVHIADVEHAWIARGLAKQLPESHVSYEDYPTLESAKRLSDECYPEVKAFVDNWSDELEHRPFHHFTYGEIMHHVAAHEVHHIGQLSVWIRELGIKPPTANLVGRGLYGLAR